MWLNFIIINLWPIFILIFASFLFFYFEFIIMLWVVKALKLGHRKLNILLNACYTFLTDKQKMSEL